VEVQEDWIHDEDRKEQEGRMMERTVQPRMDRKERKEVGWVEERLVHSLAVQVADRYVQSCGPQRIWRVVGEARDIPSASARMSGLFKGIRNGAHFTTEVIC